MTYLGLVDYPARTLHLLAFSLAPSWLSPDPTPATPAQGALALAVLVALLVAAFRFHQRLGSKLATGAAALTVTAVMSSLLWVAWLVPAGEPLGRGARYVGPLWWVSLTLAAAACAHRLLLPEVRLRAAAVIGCLVAILGVFQLWRARPLLTSSERMWQRAIELEPSHGAAVMSLSTALAKRGAHRDVLSLADRCLAADRSRCDCHGLRVMAMTRLRRAREASALARGARDFCGDHALLLASQAHSLALLGQHDEALAQAERAAENSSGGDDLVAMELHHARGIAYQGLGRQDEALAEARAAVEAGGGRDAHLLAAAMAIAAGELELGARHVDRLLEASPDDPDALYNRALIADHRNDFNAAREGYLATLRQERDYAAARYNLAVLTWRRGVKPEARHHAELFVRDYPQDPRGPALKAMMAGSEHEPTPTWVPSPAKPGDDAAPPPAEEGED